MSFADSLSTIICGSMWYACVFLFVCVDECWDDDRAITRPRTALAFAVVYVVGVYTLIVRHLHMRETCVGANR